MSKKMKKLGGLMNEITIQNNENAFNMQKETENLAR
jgi:hypothetical protein